ncbi:hypothetical protein BDV95DRAFT_595924 [Massariosphaeria phaeospora]|uniref:Enoyl reductase (ER) domain-containing protein n=1 Tax=Massariosphaeria phaeospora TaxID=100035 RepID=A0A7C8M711_9PLEO|nr:hypothetical protein BDV95DRAFT_595924 [Massariosphaeria phaeospora]
MATMRAWQYTSAAGGLENNLFLPATGAPKPRVGDNEVLVEIFSMALNPADYKYPELGLVAKAMVPSPAIPGMDYCGKVVDVGSKVDAYKLGQLVFGAKTGAVGHGSLAQFIAVPEEMVALVPEGTSVDDAASVSGVGVTGCLAIQPYVKKGDRVFINGGSGGTGILGIQIAKALGCHVTTSCSEANMDLCRGIGADEVIDYKTRDIIKTLQEKSEAFDHVVDNVGIPANLYKVSHNFLKPTGTFVQVGVGSGMGDAAQLVGNLLQPGFLGGGKRKYKFIMASASSDHLSQLAAWMKEGKIRAVIDSVFEFDDAPKAFEKLKTGRAKGKIVVHVKKEQD